MLTRMTNKNEKGFTLIELMIVIAIIGILAAIAIPQFNAYRARSYNASANADVRNIITALEGYFVDFDTYPSGDPETVLVDYGYDDRSSGVVLGDITGGVTYSLDETYNSKAEEDAITFTVDNGNITKTLP